MSGWEESEKAESGLLAETLRAAFPILSRGVAWLDNAATTQRPESVLQAMDQFYREHNANARRSVHRLGAEATAAYEHARTQVAQFVGAGESAEIVFTSGTTSAIHLVAFGLAQPRLSPGDVVWVSALEHHSNWVPWQQVVQRTGAVLKVIPLTPDGKLDIEAFRVGLQQGRAKWVAVSWVSNVIGIENDVCAICDLAHSAGALVLVDGAQGVAHLQVNVASLGCDFFAFSAHKMFGPMGVGVLWGRRTELEKCEPVQFGGEMVARVDELSSTWAELPYRLEAGTPNIAGAVGLSAAIEWIRALPSGAHEWVSHFAQTAAAQLAELPGVQTIGPSRGRISLVSFIVAGIHPHDIAQVLDECGVAVRAGHLCAQPLLRRLGVESVVRASFAPYNTIAEVTQLVAGVRRAQELFR